MSELNLDRQSEEKPVGNAWAGIGLTILLHLIQIPLAILFMAFSENGLYFFPILFIGISQLIYMIPAIVVANGKGKSHIVQGLIIGASITFLLNAACVGLTLLREF